MTAAPKSIDLKSLAHDLLGAAQRQLQRQLRVTPMVLIISPEGNRMFQIEEGDPEEREEIYANLLAQAREKNALAVVTVSHVSLRSESRIPSRSRNEPSWSAFRALVFRPGP